MFSKFFIERPIFATVLALLFVVAGLVTLNILPRGAISRYYAAYRASQCGISGANAETVAQT